MTSGRILADAPPPKPGSFAEKNGGRHKGMAEPGKVAAPDSTISKLQQVVTELQEIKKLNDQLQAQYKVGSPSWHTCESIDDRLHAAFVLLGE